MRGPDELLRLAATQSSAWGSGRKRPREEEEEEKREREVGFKERTRI
jgi:hypothetical protein